MNFNPFYEKPKKLDSTLMSFKDLAVKQKGTLRPGLILCMPQTKWNLTSNEITKRLIAHHYDNLRQSTG